MSIIFEGFLSTPEALELFSERKFVGAMLRFEAALARAQAGAGLIPESAAQSITDTCKVELFDVAKIVRESGRAGSMAIPLLKSLKETVGLFNKEAAGFVHFGATDQDVMDTALALVTREAVAMIEADVHKATSALLALAERHMATPVLARTLLQPASVTSFGLTCAGWAAPLMRSLQRLQSSAASALCVQLSGSVATLAQMNGQSEQVMVCMAAELKLKASPFALHTQRDEWVALGCDMALLAGSLGKLAQDMSLMSQYEVAELAEPREAGNGGTTGERDERGALDTFHKRSPVACMAALAAAQHAPQRVAALLAAMPQEHGRAAGNWQAGLAEWPALLMAAHGSARAMAQVLLGLQVDTRRMRANLDAVRSAMPKDVAGESLNPLGVQHAAALTQAQLTFQRDALVALGTPE